MTLNLRIKVVVQYFLQHTCHKCNLSFVGWASLKFKPAYSISLSDYVHLSFNHMQTNTLALIKINTLFLAYCARYKRERIPIRQPYLNVQKGPLNEESLAEKLHRKLLQASRFTNDYFQKERFQKLVIGSISLSRLTPRETNHSNGLNTAGSIGV